MEPKMGHMERRRFTREFKLEGVQPIKDRGVSYVQAAQDLSVHQSFADDAQHAFPGHAVWVRFAKCSRTGQDHQCAAFRKADAADSAAATKALAELAGE
jgi:hypothetical protein